MYATGLFDFVSHGTFTRTKYGVATAHVSASCRTELRRRTSVSRVARPWCSSPEDCASYKGIFMAYLHCCGPPAPRTCSSSCSPSAAGPRACKWTDLFTDAAQGDGVAQAGLGVDKNICSDPPQPLQPPDRPLLHHTIMRQHLGRLLTASTCAVDIF